MRAFTIRSGTCPKLIFAVPHYRNDGTCLCDGRPVFEMTPNAIRLFREGTWIDLNQALTELFAGKRSYGSVSAMATWESVYTTCMREGWPGDWSGTTTLAQKISETHKASVFGVFKPHAGVPDEVYFQGHQIPVAAPVAP